VRVSGSRDQLRFLDEVGAFGPRTQPARALATILRETRPNTNVDTLPEGFFVQVRQVMRERGVTHRELAAHRGTAYGGKAHFAFSPSRELFAEYAEILDEDGLREIADSDLFWDRIVDIDPAGSESVYDLTVPGPASWFADSVASHNSGALEQDSDIVMFIYRDEVYNPESHDKGTAEVQLAKHRNGPVGKITLTFMPNYTKFADHYRDRNSP
jgi:replicative DNA helicase